MCIRDRIYSVDDLNRLQSNNPSVFSEDSRDRDPSDLIGNWEQQKMSMGMFITVDSDQTAPSMGSMNGMDPAEGGITISNDEFTTELNYLTIGDLFDFREGDRNVNASNMLRIMLIVLQCCKVRSLLI